MSTKLVYCVDMGRTCYGKKSHKKVFRGIPRTSSIVTSVADIADDFPDGRVDLDLSIVDLEQEVETLGEVEETLGEVEKDASDMHDMSSSLDENNRSAVGLNTVSIEKELSLH